MQAATVGDGSTKTITNQNSSGVPDHLRLGDAMDDGGTVPDCADGMGCLALEDGRLVLVRNHELTVDQAAGAKLASGFDRKPGGEVLPGGTTTIVLDPANLRADSDDPGRLFRSDPGHYSDVKPVGRSQIEWL
jgi:hypothetical protein